MILVIIPTHLTASLHNCNMLLLILDFDCIKDNEMNIGNTF